MTEHRRVTMWVTAGVLAVLVVGAVVIARLVPSLRRDAVELCRRDFRRSDAVWTDDKVRALGSIHRVGVSRVGEDLWTGTSSWPEGRCDGLTPTVLLSHHGDGWTPWALVGGP
jgi:hypothetical protein